MTAAPEVIAALEAGREKISDPARWVRGFYAIDADGEPVPCNDAGACAWCSVGALGYLEVAGAAGRLLRAEMGGNIPEYNDSHTHPEVLAAWDRAIALAKGEAK